MIKTFEGFFGFGNKNNKIVKDLIEYVKNNIVKKYYYSDLRVPKLVYEFYIIEEIFRPEDPFGEEITNDGDHIEISRSIIGHTLKINGNPIEVSEKLLNKLYKEIYENEGKVHHIRKNNLI